jgi:hypothetical protein
MAPTAHAPALLMPPTLESSAPACEGRFMETRDSLWALQAIRFATSAAIVISHSLSCKSHLVGQAMDTQADGKNGGDNHQT